MSKKAKIIIIISASLAVLVIAFLLIRPGQKEGVLQNTVQNLFPFGQPKSPDDSGTSSSTLGAGSQLTPITDETTQTTNTDPTSGSGSGNGSQGTGSVVTTEQTSFTIPSLTNPSGTTTTPQVVPTGTPTASNGGLNATPASDLANRPTITPSTTAGINCYSRLGSTCFNKIESAIYFAKQELAEIDKIITMLRGDTNTQGMSDRLMNLDQCIPGPDYGYENRMRSLLESSDEWRKIGETGLSLFDTRKKAGINLEMTETILNIRTEMGFRTKNIPMAQDGLSFINATPRYNEVLRDYRDRKIKRTRTLGTLENLNSAWKATKVTLASDSTNAPALADQQRITTLFANFGIDLPTQDFWLEAVRTEDQIRNEVEQIKGLQTQCDTQRNTLATSVSSQKTYIGSRIQQPISNLVDTDNNKKLFCSVDPYQVNNISREIDCRIFSDGSWGQGVANNENNDQVCGGDLDDDILNSDPQWHDVTINGPAEILPNILRRHNFEIPINFVRDDEGGAGGQGWFNDHPNDVLVDDHAGLTAHSLFSLGLRCDTFYKSSRYDYIDELTLYGY